MLAMGLSQPWPDALEETHRHSARWTPRRSCDYFAPLAEVARRAEPGQAGRLVSRRAVPKRPCHNKKIHDRVRRSARSFSTISPPAAIAWCAARRWFRPTIPTLLFTNAGMNQFKDVFLGQEKRDYTRATTSQKCVRAGGKHNDLDNVGYTRRHHTFFEMLGNFSFGDYFKRDAIAFAWELITKDYGLPKDKLYVTVFREDDDAEELWQEVAGVPKDRIFRLDEKDNFWQMGETGPCGPCSEIHYDFGPEAGPTEAFPDDAGERFVEIWNLVFMQYDRDAAGQVDAAAPAFDRHRHGSGAHRRGDAGQALELRYRSAPADRGPRRRAVRQKPMAKTSRTDTVLRINADHARATAFLIHDGVLPSNEGRGYVLRKIMRRAMRNARMIGATDPYLYQLTGFVAEHMRDAYPEMMESVPRVARVVKDEEHRYATTFQVAEKVFQDEAKAAAGGCAAGRGGIQAVRHVRAGAR